MHYMALPVSFRWDEAFVGRIDSKRGLVSRSAFMREAAERLMASIPDGMVFGDLDDSRALEAALLDDTQATQAQAARSAAGVATRTREKASATGPVNACP